MFTPDVIGLWPRKKHCLFPVTNQKMNRVGRQIYIFLDYFVFEKCVFHACFMLSCNRKGGKSLTLVQLVA